MTVNYNIQYMYVSNMFYYLLLIVFYLLTVLMLSILAITRNFVTYLTYEHIILRQVSTKLQSRQSLHFLNTEIIKVEARGYKDISCSNRLTMKSIMLII